MKPHARIKFSSSQRMQIACRQQWDCAACNRRLHWTFEIDHMTPLCNGGSNNPDNLQALCTECHATKTRHERTGSRVFTQQALDAPRKPTVAAELQSELQLPRINEYEQYTKEYYKNAAANFMQQFAYKKG